MLTRNENRIILAPAGTREAVTAAVRCGADAVYLGGKNFNARRNAENFDDAALSETVAYCHERGCKVYVTVNTLTLDRERPLLLEEADYVARSGADAVIIQDPAVMRLFARRYPALRRHASTQTVVHNLDGAKYLQDLGYQTVVLARELTLREIETICSGIDIQAEAFVHGAHCMGVSGACYLSAMLGGRSGNRGLCAQPCRLDWRCGEKEYALSLKDMSLLSHVQEMSSAGVSIFKIEGRMKRPEYVAAVVTAMRQALAGEPYDAERLRSVFSRSGFTDGYLTGKRDSSMFGYRTKEDVLGAEKVLRELAALYEKETPLVPVQMHFTADAASSSLQVSDGATTVSVVLPVPEPALHRSLTAEDAQKNLTKTGGTPYAVQNFTAELAPGLMLPASALNAARREALAALGAQRRRPVEYENTQLSFPPSAPPKGEGEPVLWARFSDASQIPAETEPYQKIILPVACLAARQELLSRFGEKLVAELPAVLWPEDEPALEETLAALRAEGLREALGDNIYALPLCRRTGLALRGGAGLNVLNSETVAHYEQEGLLSVTASYEADMRSVKALSRTRPLGIVAYGRLPLMRFRNCPVRASLGCAKCAGRASLTDRRNVSFPLACSGRKYSTLLNSVPLHLAERNLQGLDYVILYFTSESPAVCAEVTADFLQHRKSAAPRTGGLYYRELL